MTIFVCVHQGVRGGDRECNQHILHHTGYIERYASISIKKGSCCVMACKCYCNARSGRGLGHGDEELSKESSAKRSVRKNGIPTESGIAWNYKDFAKSS